MFRLARAHRSPHSRGALTPFAGRDSAPTRPRSPQPASAPTPRSRNPCAEAPPFREGRVMAAWKLFGRDVTTEQLPAELRSILAQMQRERVAFEALTNAARESSQNLTQLTQPISDAQKTVSELQARVKALERLVPVLATLDEQTEAGSRGQRRTETQLTNTTEDAKRLRGEIEELRGTFEQALALKNDLTGFLELGGGFKALRMDADKLGAEVREITQGFDRVRERQEELRRTGEAVATRLNAFEERQQQVQGGVATTESRVTALGQTLQELKQAAADAVQTKRQLGTLKTLADAATQKVSALEQQREVVERVTGQVAHLHDLMREVDGKIRRHEESAKSLGELEAKVSDLKALHGDLLERTEEIRGRHDEAKRADEELRGRLATLRDEVQRTVKRFELENQGLDAVSQRILDLRGGLTDMETRSRSLAESSRTITDLGSKADGLATQLSGITESMAQLETQAQRVHAVEANAVRLGETVEDMTQQVARLEKAKPAMEAALQDVAGLKGTHEAVKGALEQVQVAESEIARMREGQAGTKAWLTSATESVSALRGELAAVEEMKPTVELVRAEADRLSQAMAQIEARRPLAEEMNKRVSELASLGGQLEERGRGLLARMDGADERFQTLAAHADEAARIEKLVPTAVATVERAERRAADVDTVVASLEARAQNLEGLAERTRALGQELEVRQGALDKASGHLGAAAQLRGQVAERTTDDVRSISAAKEDVTQTRAMLENVLGLVSHVHDAANGLDHRKRQVEQAEERLGRVEALLADIHAGFEMLHGQKALMDQVIAQAGSLEFHTKQAEALIATLREEREITDTVRAAVAQLRQEKPAKSA